MRPRTATELLYWRSSSDDGLLSGREMPPPPNSSHPRLRGSCRRRRHPQRTKIRQKTSRWTTTLRSGTAVLSGAGSRRLRSHGPGLHSEQRSGLRSARRLVSPALQASARCVPCPTTSCRPAIAVMADAADLRQIVFFHLIHPFQSHILQTKTSSSSS